MATVPVNYRRGAIAATEVIEAARYARQGFEGYVQQLAHGTRVSNPEALRRLNGARLLELGPGRSLGTAVLLASAGARVSVADRFMPTWDDEYHAPIFEALLDVCAVDRLSLQPIRDALAARAFPPAVTGHRLAAEQLGRIGGQFDLVLSNAVLEHVEDIAATAWNLAAVTAAGGLGLHQIDLRDHRDFARPLEFLTLPADAFAQLRRQSHCECGGCWRAADVAAAFDAHGFDVEIDVTMHASPEYLADVRPRLQPEYARLADAELSIVSALFRLRRRAGETDHQA
jgi:hypothetical protein